MLVACWQIITGGLTDRQPEDRGDLTNCIWCTSSQNVSCCSYKDTSVICHTNQFQFKKMITCFSHEYNHTYCNCICWEKCSGNYAHVFLGKRSMSGLILHLERLLNLPFKKKIQKFLQFIHQIAQIIIRFCLRAAWQNVWLHDRAKPAAYSLELQLRCTNMSVINLNSQQKSK